MNQIKSFEEYLEWLSSNATYFAKKKKRQKKAPLHPGRYLQTEYLQKQGISQSELARRLSCTHAKINEIVNGKRAISPEFALLLEREFREPAELWISLQASYNLWLAREKQNRSRSRYS